MEVEWSGRGGRGGVHSLPDALEPESWALSSHWARGASSIKRSRFVFLPFPETLSFLGEGVGMEVEWRRGGEIIHSLSGTVKPKDGACASVISFFEVCLMRTFVSMVLCTVLIYCLALVCGSCTHTRCCFSASGWGTGRGRNTVLFMRVNSNAENIKIKHDVLVTDFF